MNLGWHGKAPTFVLPRLRGFRQGLIGPTVFPAYLFALKAGLGITLIFAVELSALAPATAGDLPSRVVHALMTFTRGALLVFAWTTLAFAAIDFWQSRLLLRTSWDPRLLPPVVRLENRISRLDSLYELLFMSAGLVWLLLVPSWQFLVLGGAVRILELTPIWRVVYLPLVGLAAAAVVLSAVNLSRPFWTPARSVARIALHVGWLVMFLVLLRADQWVAAKAGARLPDGESLESVVDGINMGCRVGFTAANIVTIAGIVREILRVRSRRRAASSAARIEVASADAGRHFDSGHGLNARPSGLVELLERYLQAVRFFLPRRQQDQVAAEVSAALLAQIADLEKAIGRTLTDDERADVVRRYGHPLVVAGRYGDREHLVSPSLFPVFLGALSVAFALTFLITVGWALLSPAPARDPRSHLAGIFRSLPGRELMVFACTTLAFATVDRWQLRRQADVRASRERQDAQAIQRALLPASLPAMNGCDLAVRWQPASAFGGDCYDAIRVSDTALALSIADVCGKGLPAALVMSSLQASLRAFAFSDPAPRFVVSHLNRALCRNAELRRFVTLFYGVYDSNTRRLIYINAGHNPPALIRSDGSIVRLVAGGMVVGMFDQAIYEQGEMRLEPGDRLVLFTDGITEAESSDGLEFGDDRLLETVVRYRMSDPDRLLRGLFDEVASFAGRYLRDDATAVAMAIR